MKSITIHNLEEPLNTLIRERAKKEGLSLNKIIKKLLAESLGISFRDKKKRENDFLDLFGKLSAEEELLGKDKMLRKLLDMRQIPSLLSRCRVLVLKPG